MKRGLSQSGRVRSTRSTITNERALESLGWSAQVDLVEGMRETIAWSEHERVCAASASAVLAD